MMRKKIYGICGVALAASLSLMTACGSGQAGGADTMAQSDTTGSEATDGEESQEDVEENGLEYVSKLFDTGVVHSIDIEIAEEDWADLLENPTDKTKYEVNITIDGEKIEDVSFATKGNTSLSSVAMDENFDRYSFKVNFGKYVEDQTYYGLDKLCLNNIYSDNTYIKDYLSQQLFNHMGVDAPLTSFADITINGESWGLYLAVEDVSDAFLQRTGNTEGDLYKPETSMLSKAGDFKGGQRGDFDPKNMPEDFDPENMPEDFDPENMPEGFDPENIPEGFGPENAQGDSEEAEGDMRKQRGGQGGFGGFGGQDSGASLKYTDDELSSYTDIFDNAETDSTEEDQERLIAALKKLSEGNVEESVDIDSVINYFVVHNFTMNYDSYTGNMLHNYYLYEEDGKLKMIPWDYNLAYGNFMHDGGFGRGMRKETDENENATKEVGASENSSDLPETANASNSATKTINYGIDSPLSGAQEEDRPMWSWITSNDEYLEKYHDSFEKLTEYLLSDEFQSELDRVYEMILPYVEKDTTAFATADEFKTGFETIREFIRLRSESIKKQLNGELATVTDEQNEADRVDAEGLDLNSMGSNHMMRGRNK